MVCGVTEKEFGLLDEILVLMLRHRDGQIQILNLSKIYKLQVSGILISKFILPFVLH
jgi:hypothetical protein